MSPPTSAGSWPPKGSLPPRFRYGGLAWTGQALPFAEESVDAALSTWTLCTIPDVAAALRELPRVLKPTLHSAHSALLFAYPRTGFASAVFS